VRSFLDLQFLGSSIFGFGLYDACCIDKDATLEVTSIGGGNYSVPAPCAHQFIPSMKMLNISTLYFPIRKTGATWTK
jgi:hypothetical protein